MERELRRAIWKDVEAEERAVAERRAAEEAMAQIKLNQAADCKYRVQGNGIYNIRCKDPVRVAVTGREARCLRDKCPCLN